VTETIIRGATVGMKEAETSLISVLNSLFTPLTRKRVKELGLTEAEETKYVGRLSREVDGCGRESSIAVGEWSQVLANLLKINVLTQRVSPITRPSINMMRIFRGTKRRTSGW
jgi:chromosome transmission fidelity protein 18